MTEFENNLRAGDRVLEAKTKRPGQVAKRPWKKNRAVVVLFQGEPHERRVDVMDLRLVVDGVAEEVPPISGEPPSLEVGRRAPSEGSSESDPVAVLKTQRSRLKLRMDAMNEEAKGIRLLMDRTDKAIAALEGAA